MDEDNIITLNDENGNEVEFEFLDLIPYRQNEYVVLLLSLIHICIIQICSMTAGCYDEFVSQCGGIRLPHAAQGSRDGRACGNHRFSWFHLWRNYLCHCCWQWRYREPYLLFTFLKKQFTRKFQFAVVRVPIIKLDSSRFP